MYPVNSPKRKHAALGICALLLAGSVSVWGLSAGDVPPKTAGPAADTSLVETRSNRHTQPESQAPAPANHLGLEGFEKKLENGRLEVWFEENAAAIRVVDKDSGYIWGGLSDDETEEMNDQWADMAVSLLTLEYYNANNNVKKISLSSEEAQTAYSWDSETMVCRFSSEDIGVELVFTMTLTADGLRFAVVPDSLKEQGENRLKSLYFVPFLGSTVEDGTPGYMFIPDGAGALIRYKKSSDYVKPYEARIYGQDLGMDQQAFPGDLVSSRTNDYMTDSQQATLPVYGMVHGAGHNGLLGVVSAGEEYAHIVAYPAGVTTDCNWVTARFDYRMLYTEPTSKDGTGIQKVQKTVNPVNPEIRLYFLTGEEADYSGMAVRYRTLLEEASLLGKERIDERLPLRLDVLGAEVKKGFLFNSLSILTTTKQAEGFLRDLEEAGIGNLTMIYRGWNAGGLSGARFGSLRFENRVGGRSDFNALRDLVTGAGGRFYLGVNPVTANEDQITLLSGTAISLSNQQVVLKRQNPDILYPDTYFVKAGLLRDAVGDSLVTLTGFPLAFDQLGHRLYSDYTRKTPVTRRDMKGAVAESLAAAGKQAAVYMPNEYLYGHTGEYLDIPMSNSQYLYETDTVPFVQIVLKGCLDYYAPPLNQGLYSVYSVLQMAEYGAYPSFLVTQAPNTALVNTPLEDYFSLSFGDWKDSIVECYEKLDGVLSQVEGKRIRRHTALDWGLMRVEYEDGTQIFVNYRDESRQVGDVTIPALGLCVKGGDR